MSVRPARVNVREKATITINTHEALPAGTWLVMRGVRRFMPADPTWKPTDGVDHEAESVLMKLMTEPPQVDAPPYQPYRHICHCGCLLFGIENCPNCEWLAISHGRTA